MRGIVFTLVLDLARFALIVGASQGLWALVGRLTGTSEASLQPLGIALTLFVAVPYAVAALVSSRFARLFRWRRRAAVAGAALGLVAAALVTGAPPQAYTVPLIALAVTLAVERLR